MPGPRRLDREWADGEPRIAGGSQVFYTYRSIIFGRDPFSLCPPIMSSRVGEFLDSSRGIFYSPYQGFRDGVRVVQPGFPFKFLPPRSVLFRPRLETLHRPERPIFQPLPGYGFFQAEDTTASHRLATEQEPNDRDDGHRSPDLDLGLHEGVVLG